MYMFFKELSLLWEAVFFSSHCQTKQQLQMNSNFLHPYHCLFEK